MSINHLYSDFSAQPHNSDSAESGANDALQEEASLAAFEKGYQAGWDDAAKAHRETQQATLSDLSQTFQDMAFTYQEVFSKFTLAMQPLLTSIVTKLLPEAARTSMGAQILAEATRMLKSQSDGFCEIFVAPDALPVVEDIAKRVPQLPFEFSTDPDLRGGQAFIRYGEVEREIDLDSVQQSIAEAVEAFFEQIEGGLQHG